MAVPIIDRPPAWVYQRIIAAGGDTGPRYEASLYGPTNSLLTSYFPVKHQFMVKPQGKIRPEFINDDPTIRTSLDSYHAEVLPRGLHGSEVGVQIPDFIVVKATESMVNDRVLMVIEIKPSDCLLADSMEQLTNYLEAFAQKYHQETEEPLFNTLYGMLVVGKKVKLVTFPIGGEPEWGSSSLIDVTSVRVDSFLRNIAITNGPGGQ